MEDWEIKEANKRLNDYLCDWSNVRRIDAEVLGGKLTMVVEYR